MADEEKKNNEEEKDEEDTDEEETKKEEEKDEEVESSDDDETPTSSDDESVGADDSEDEGEDVEVPEKFKDLIETIEEMPVLELNELVKAIEAKWGVSAQAVAAGPADGGGEEEEKSEYTVELADFGDSKIGVIKAVKSALGLGLKEAKTLVEDAPTTLKDGVPTEDAEEMKEAIEEAGGSVELK